MLNVHVPVMTVQIVDRRGNGTTATSFPLTMGGLMANRMMENYALEWLKTDGLDMIVLQNIDTIVNEVSMRHDFG